MMTDLALCPSYPHTQAVSAPKSRLRAESDEAAMAYRTLYIFLAIGTRPLCPAEGWNEQYARDLFERGGFHYPVRWMPRIGDGWRRLTYCEFCVWYGLC